MVKKLISRHNILIKIFKPMQDKYLVYGLIDPLTVQLRYVGKSCKSLRRARASAKEHHLATYKGRWLNLLHQKGLIPLIIIIGLFKSREQVANAEKKYISFFRKKNIPLTNIDEGGEGFSHNSRNAKPYKGVLKNGMTLPEYNRSLWATNKEFREEQSRLAKERWKDETYRRNVTANIKDRYPPERREKMSRVQRNNFSNELHKTKVMGKIMVKIIAINIESGERKHYDYINKAARELQLCSPNISKVLRGEREKVGKYRFEYAERSTPIFVSKKKCNRLKATDIKSGRIYEFESVKIACKEMGFSSPKISCVIKRQRKSHKGFIFEYIKEKQFTAERKVA